MTQYQKKRQPNEKWAKDLNRYFPKKTYKDTNKHMKKYSASFIIREMH